jgi:hypothetical protein
MGSMRLAHAVADHGKISGAFYKMILFFYEKSRLFIHRDMLPFRLRSQFTIAGARNSIAEADLNGYSSRQDRDRRKTVSAHFDTPFPFNAQSSLVCRRLLHEFASRQHDLRIFRFLSPPHVFLS